MSDPFVAGRNGGFGGDAGAIPFAEESALGYAAKKPRVPRDAFAKFPTKADVARNDLFDRRWSVWGAAFGGGSNTAGNAALGSNDATARAFGFAVGADYRLSRDTLAGFALAGGGTNFSVVRSRLAGARTCSRPAPSCVTIWARPTSPPRRPMAGRT